MVLRWHFAAICSRKARTCWITFKRWWFPSRPLGHYSAWVPLQFGLPSGRSDMPPNTELEPPAHPAIAWSHLLFTFTNADSGTIFDEAAGQLKGVFRFFPPSPPVLDVVRQPPTGVMIGVSSQAGQMIVVQESTNLPAWSAVATNILWTGRWTMP